MSYLDEISKAATHWNAFIMKKNDFNFEAQVNSRIRAPLLRHIILPPGWPPKRSHQQQPSWQHQ